MIEMYLAASRRAGSRRLRDPVGVDVGGDRLEPEREGVRRGRGVAKPPARSRLPTSTSTVSLPAQLGRELRERSGDGGDRRQRRRLPRGDRRRRGSPSRPSAGGSSSRGLKSRGLRGVRMFTATRPPGAGQLDRRGLPERRLPAHVHFYRNALASAQVQEAKAAAMLRPYTPWSRARPREAKSPRGGRRARLNEAEGGREGRPRRIRRDLTYTRFPREHWRRIRTNNAGIERLNRGIRRRTRVVGTFPDGKSPHARDREAQYVAEPWGSRRYLDVTLLEG